MTLLIYEHAWSMYEYGMIHVQKIMHGSCMIHTCFMHAHILKGSLFHIWKRPISYINHTQYCSCMHESCKVHARYCMEHALVIHQVNVWNIHLSCKMLMNGSYIIIHCFNAWITHYSQTTLMHGTYIIIHDVHVWNFNYSCTTLIKHPLVIHGMKMEHMKHTLDIHNVNVWNKH